MDELIKALQIFSRYRKLQRPTHCEHDQLCIVGIKEDEVSAEDRLLLKHLGFFWSEDDEGWISFRFGSS